MSGIERIAAERQRQVDVEGWSAEHDDEHDDGSLAMAAVCYAAVARLYVLDPYADFDRDRSVIEFRDPWPGSWDARFDKRCDYGSSRETMDGEVPDPATYTAVERMDLLVKAGALIAAEIDRLEREASDDAG